jgi:hypothetical protein
MMDIKNHLIRHVHVPHKLIFKNQIYEITKIDNKFTIKGFTVKTVNRKIDKITINNPHPNANPRSGDFCIPNSLRDHELNSDTIKMIENMLCIFNLDDCYFTPWDEIQYRKQEVLGAWQRKLKT